MIGTTKRFQIQIQAGETLEKDLVPCFDQLSKLVDSNLFRRFKSATILGKLPDGTPRGPIVVGDKPSMQFEYVDAKEDFAIKTPEDLKQLFIVITNSKPTSAIVVIQF